MGKAIVNTYPNKILKSTIGKRNKKYAEKTQLKRKHSDETENVLPFKRVKVKQKATVDDNRKSTIEPKVDAIIIKNGTLYLSQAKQSDIFFDDELKATYFKNLIRDPYLNILEEVSLEGLDGITIEGKVFR